MILAYEAIVYVKTRAHFIHFTIFSFLAHCVVSTKDSFYFSRTFDSTGVGSGGT